MVLKYYEKAYAYYKLKFKYIKCIQFSFKSSFKFISTEIVMKSLSFGIRIQNERVICVQSLSLRVGKYWNLAGWKAYVKLFLNFPRKIIGFASNFFFK